MPALVFKDAQRPMRLAQPLRWPGLDLLVLCLLGLCLMLAAVHTQAATHDESSQRAYFTDPTGQMSLAEVKRQTFQPFGRSLSLSYRADTVWLRLRVDPELDRSTESSLDGTRLVLRLTNPLLDDVRLYDPLQNSGQPIVTGDSHPNTETELDLSSLTFLLPRGDEPREIYVSVRSTSSLVFSVVLEPVEQALKHNRTYDLLGGLYLGLLLVFFVLAVALRIGHADRVTNWFILQQALAIVWSLTLMGYTRQYLGPWLGLSSVNGVANLIILAYTFSVCQFGMVFLSQFKLRAWARALVYFPMVVFPPLILAMLLGYARLSLFINALLIIIFSVVGLVIVLLAIDWKADSARVLPRWLVTFFFVLFGFATPLATTVTLRVEPLFQNAFVGFFFTTALGGVLMSTLLLYRARSQAREAIVAATALKLQQQRSQEQAKFLGLLAHEFKTPLSIIKMVMGSGQLDDRSSGYSLDAIRNMDALLEKCLQAEALMDTPAAVKPVNVHIEALVGDVVLNSGYAGDIEVQGTGQTEIRSDPALVRIILANLVDNALKYGKPGVQVRVSVAMSSGKGDEVSVRVTNAVGRAGVPDAEHVFDKYYRASGALSQSGWGLGLYLSKHIAQVLGGDLSMHLDGDSLSFELRLPA